MSAGFAAAAAAAGYYAVVDADTSAIAGPRGIDDIAERIEPYGESDEAPEGMVPDVPATLLAEPEGGGASDDTDLLDPADDSVNILEHTLAPGETVGNTLSDMGIDGSGAAELIEAMNPHFDFRRARDGDQLVVAVSREEDHVESFEYRRSPIDIWVGTRNADEELVVRKKTVETTTKIVKVGSSIRGSLYHTIERIGEHTSLVAYFTDLFAWDIDFYVDTQVDDRVKIVVEKIYHEGTFLKYGRVLAAEYEGKVGTFRAYYFEDSDGKTGYYDDSGVSVRKSFLKTPLKFVRVTSKFKPKRMHPILHRVTKHLGVDYAAPTGTPVRSVSDGVVTFAGWKGGNGNLVVVKHKNGYVSAYAHLSKIPASIKPGVNVDQKRIIGYVGSTGYSTGAHLHFALMKGGAYINPLNRKMIPAEPIPVVDKAAFKALSASMGKSLDAIKVIHPHLIEPTTGLATTL